MDDKERIEFIIREKGLTNVEFSAITGIAPATLSHITSGRSKPTLPIMRGIIKGFPDLNPGWVFMGEGSIYKTVDAEGEVSATSNLVDVNGGLDLFSSVQNNSDVTPSEIQKSRKNPYVQMVNPFEMKEIIRESVVSVLGHQHRKIVEVRIFFDDGTYEAFSTPKEAKGATARG